MGSLRRLLGLGLALLSVAACATGSVAGGSTGDDAAPCTEGATQVCYTGAAATEGVGLCSPGSQTCQSGSWGSCTGEVLPTMEVCDGKDNNCNGLVDEGCSCTADSSQSCYTGPPASEGVGPCVPGTQQCSDMVWGDVCSGEITPMPEICDGIDNNCNGVIDEGCTCTAGASQSCYTGSQATEGVGTCTAGQQECEMSGWGACTGSVLPVAEICNGKDDNCNSIVDDEPTTDQWCVQQDGPNHVCKGGKCQCAPQNLCGGKCVNLQNDGNNCGKCGDVCPASSTCTAGACACDAGLTECSGACVDTSTDASDCGSCGTVCTGGETCQAGKCACPSGDTDCSGTCVDTRTDGNDCGTCGTVCPAGEGCQDGACGCNAPTVACSGTCVDESTNPSDCGSCGNVCPVGGSCSSGTCVCPGGDTNCSGTCQATGSDPSNCGTCGNVCPVGGSCSGGTCVCPGGDTNCSGTCVDTQTDPNNCGTCGTSCGAEACSGGGCVSTCPYVYAYDGRDLRYESTVGGASLIGGPHQALSGRSMRFAPLWVRLDGAAVDRRAKGTARAQLLIAEDEIAYVDELHLTVVDHRPGYEVLTSSSAEWPTLERDDPQEFYALRTAALRAPEHASWLGRADVTHAIGTLDDRAVDADVAADNFYELDFGGVRDPSHARLVIDGWKYQLMRGLAEDVPRRAPHLEVQGPDGEWHHALGLAQPRGDRKTVVVDLSAVAWPEGRYHMRFYTGTNEEGLAMWYVDRVRLTEEAPGPVTTIDLPASKADLRFVGAPSYVDRSDFAHPRWNHDDGLGALAQVGTTGTFTRYGDVRELTSAADDELVVMRQGDGIDLSFAGVPRPAPGHESTLWLRAELLFKPHVCMGCDEPTETSEGVFPLPFHGMTRYPYGPDEHYPDDAAHRSSLDRFDTRTYAPGDRRWGP